MQRGSTILLYALTATEGQETWLALAPAKKMNFQITGDAVDFSIYLAQKPVYFSCSREKKHRPTISTNHRLALCLTLVHLIKFDYITIS